MIIELMSICKPTDGSATEKETAYSLCEQLKRAIELKDCDITVRQRTVDVPGTCNHPLTYDVVVKGDNIPQSAIDSFYNLKAMSYFKVDGEYHDCVRTDAWKNMIAEYTPPIKVVTELEYIGVDDWHNNKYKDKNGRILVDIGNSKDPRHPTDLHTVSPDLGEPDTPVHFDNIEVTGWTDADQLQKDHEFEYMMLSSLQAKISDYKAFGYTKESIIAKMRHYYNLLPVKPEWCTKEDIDRYEQTIE